MMGQNQCPACEWVSRLCQKLGDPETCQQIISSSSSPGEAARRIVETFGARKVLDALAQLDQGEK